MGRHFSNFNIRGRPGFRDGWQHHHLIPYQCISDPRTRVLMAVMIGLGFCFNDFPRNGILLPNTFAQSAIFHLPYHSGSHPNYNERVIGMVVQLTNRYDFVENPVEARYALSVLRYVQASLRTGMHQQSPVSIDDIAVTRSVKGRASVDRAMETMLN